MKKKETLASRLYLLRNKYKQAFPKIVSIAETCDSAELFKERLRALILSDTKNRKEITNRILFLIENDGTTVDELSTGERLEIKTIAHLWNFLCGNYNNDVSPDLFTDLFHQFRLLKHHDEVLPDRNVVKRQMNRWVTGLDENVIAIRKANKERIIHKLIEKIDPRRSTVYKYQFAEGMNYDEKFAQVYEWWNNSHFHLSMAIKGPLELNSFMGNALSQETMEILIEAKKKKMPFFITPYYLSLLNPDNHGFDDETIRSYILYSKALVETYGSIKAWEKEDIVEAGKPNAAGWLLPDGHNIHRRYPEVAILIPDSMGRACGGLCASCQRMYDFQSERLNFDFEALKPKETWGKKLRRLMQYFENDAQLRDILITGGDAFMSQNSTLRKILDAVYLMAKRKHKDNEARADGEKYAELQRVRLGSRLLAYLPNRVTDELVDVLRDFKAKASEVGVSQFYIQTHFQSPLEVTPEAEQAIKAILSAGWIVTNQLVYNVAASRRGHTAKLRQTLNSIGVVCYYTFSVKGFMENYSVFTPNSRSLQEANEEKVFGIVPDSHKDGLSKLMNKPENLSKTLPRFLRSNKLLFAGTDRNVLNLPAIGKSMTFRIAGITSEGKRILKFEHDGSRRHSPIIDSIGKVYIVENKSIAAYLEQLKEMGENINEYRSIWNYCEGVTEPRFSLYEYPSYSFRQTKEMTNLLL
jgi:Lysine 2,3-aminomutase